MKTSKMWCAGILMAVGLIASVPAISRADEASMNGNGGMMVKDGGSVAISGYCPVCVMHGNMKKGSDNFTTEYNGKVYKFVGLEQQKSFVDNPEEFTKDLDAKYQKLGGT